MDVSTNSDSDKQVVTADELMRLLRSLTNPESVDEEGKCENIETSFEPDSDDDDNDECPDDKSWCTDCWCSNCADMSSRKDAVCCQDDGPIEDKANESLDPIKCITEHEGFIANCLNHRVLEISYYEYMIEHGAMMKGQMIHELYRQLSYGRFKLWCYGMLDEREMRKIPSCAVVKIEEAFPSEQLCDFKYPDPHIQQ